MTDYTISSKISNEMVYACYRGRFWYWNGSIWKESRIMTHRFELARAADKNLTPQSFLTNGAEFAPLDEYEIDCAMLDALENAKPCKNAPIDPVEEDSSSSVPASCICSTCTCGGCKEECFGNCHSCGHPVQECNSYQTEGEKHLTPAHSADVTEPVGNIPAAPGFDFSPLGELSGQAAEADQQFDLHYGAAQDEYLVSCIYLARIHALTAKAGRYGGGTWTKWYESKGLSHGSVTKMVQNGEAFNSSTVDELKQLPNLTRKDLNLIARSGCADQVVAAAGDSQRVQELLAQIKAKDDAIAAEKERADAAEAREEEAWKLQSKSEAKAKDAETELEAVTADLNGLYDRAAQAEARNTALLDERAEYVQRIKELESRPIEVMHDPEETDRLAHQYAYGIAADMTEELRTKNNQQSQTIAALQKELEAARSTNGYDPQSDLETVCACIGSMEQMWGTALPAYERLSGKDLRTATDTLQDVIGRLYGDMARTAEDGED